MSLLYIKFLRIRSLPFTSLEVWRKRILVFLCKHWKRISSSSESSGKSFIYLSGDLACPTLRQPNVFVLWKNVSLMMISKDFFFSGYYRIEFHFQILSLSTLYTFWFTSVWVFQDKVAYKTNEKDTNTFMTIRHSSNSQKFQLKFHITPPSVRKYFVTLRFFWKHLFGVVSCEEEIQPARALCTNVFNYGCQYAWQCVAPFFSESILFDWHCELMALIWTLSSMWIDKIRISGREHCIRSCVKRFLLSLAFNVCILSEWKG